jgi:pyruvate,water dikinase
MIYDLDFSKPTPVDHPQPIFEALKIYMTDEALNPFVRQREVLSKREAADGKVRAMVSPSLYKKFKRKLDSARELAPYRENGLANLGLCQPFLRQVLLELGERLRSMNVVKEPGDVFWLHLKEVNDFINGELVGDKFDEVNERKALNKAQGKVNAPFILPKNAKMLGFSVQAWLPKEMDEDPNATVFEGLGVSGGKITGKARVIHSADEFDQMQQGEILVTAMTTPAWTPLFAMAKGIVTDFGGPLSHSSIVAREYGIPAVLGTGGTSRVIVSGQTITVDGDNGVVKIVER